jgi:hypothetical protein
MTRRHEQLYETLGRGEGGMNSVAYVTTTFPTLAAFIESEVHRLRARGVQVRVFTLGPVGRECQPEHQSLVPLTESIGSPFRLDGWLALLGWLVRRPHVLVPETIRMLWASRGSGLRARRSSRLPAGGRARGEPDRARVARTGPRRMGAFPGERRVSRRATHRRSFSMAAHGGADLYRTRAFLREKARAATFRGRVAVRGQRRDAA